MTKDPDRSSALPNSAERSDDKLKSLIGFIGRLLLVALFILLVYLIYKEFKKPRVVVEPFEVPESLANDGYTGQVLAIKFLDQCNYIIDRATAPGPKTSPTQQSLGPASQKGTGLARPRQLLPERLPTPMPKQLPIEGLANYSGAQSPTDRARGSSKLKYESRCFDPAQLQESRVPSREKKPEPQVPLPPAPAVYPRVISRPRPPESRSLTRQPQEFTHADAMAELDIEASGVDVGSVLGYLRESFPHTPRRVVGQVTLQPDQVIGLTIRLVGRPAETITGTLETLNDTLLEAAEFIMREPDPFTLASYYYNRGLDSDKDGKYDQAIKDYTKAIEYFAEAIERSPGLAELNPAATRLAPKDAADAYYTQGIAYYYRGGSGHYKRAIAAFTQAFELNPQRLTLNLGSARVKSKNANLYYTLGFACANQREYMRAVADHGKPIAGLTRVVHLKPKAALYYLRGIDYYDQGFYDQAIADYDKAIELDPDDADLYYTRGLAYAEQGYYAQAIDDYTEAIKRAPEDGDLYSTRGSAHYYQGDYEGAIADYTKAIDLAPDDADLYYIAYLYYTRGFAYYGLGDYHHAIDDV